jgi:2-amino-4-hydroxy-6-hydroxymethyldihydropteridine diphosphokinase
VLAPWHDADPDAVLPGYGPVADLLARVDQAGIRRSGAPLVVLEGDS